MNEALTAYHEAAHAVVCAVLDIPLWDIGIHIDRAVGITFNCRRHAGNRGNSPDDIAERERSIVMMKAGYIANLRINPNSHKMLAKDDQDKEEELLDEMYPRCTEEWDAANKRLGHKSQCLVEQHWGEIETLGKALMNKPETRQPLWLHCLWPASGEMFERYLSAREVADILESYGLEVKIKQSDFAVE